MRKVLLRFIFEPVWEWQSIGNELLVGAGWLMVVWCLVACVSLVVLWVKTRRPREVLISAGFWAIVPVALLFVSRSTFSIRETGIPVYGYGFMMFVGFVAGTALAVFHARRIHMDPSIIVDLMTWLLIPGLIGARVFYVVQYSERIFRGAQGLEVLQRILAVQDGGLVFYGSVIGGAVGGWLYCRRRGIRPLELADVVAPSLFVGLGLGRIGCFLYGCCYGGACTLPWAVQFPPDSLTYQAQLDAGIIDRTATATTPLHPTQIYSSLLAFLLAAVLCWCFRRRPFEGFVVGMMFVLYPINRFVLELIRNDEKGQLGTSLTISQLISIGLFLTGIVLLVWLSKKNDTIKPAPANAAGHAG